MPRRTIRRNTHRLAVASLLALVTSTASADWVELYSGEKLYGTIKEVGSRSITITTLLSNIPYDREVSLRDVRKWEFDETTKLNALRSGGDDDESDAATTEARRDTGGTTGEHRPTPDIRKGERAYIVVPLHGTFGQDIYPKGIRSALEYAEDFGITDVIFHLDSPGGEVWAAEAIKNIMDEHANTLTYHAVIKRAISASIWPSFMCENIAMSPRASFGGAVIFSQNDTGEFEVDKKFTSIRAAELETVALDRGHPQALVRAMMLSEAAVYAVPNGKGKYTITAVKPTSGPYDVIDSEDTILTLTTAQVKKYGIFPVIDDDTPEALAEGLGIDHWADAGAYGESTVDHWVGECREVRKQIESLNGELVRNLVNLGDSGSYAEAQRAIRKAKQALVRLERAARDLKDLDMDVFYEAMIENDSDRKRLIDQLDDIETELRRRRYRP